MLKFSHTKIQTNKYSERKWKNILKYFEILCFDMEFFKSFQLFDNCGMKLPLSYDMCFCHPICWVFCTLILSHPNE